jgi:hypothetical protein
MTATVEVRRRAIRDDLGVFAFSCLVVGGPVVLLVVAGLRAPREEFLGVFLLMLGLACPLWLGLAIRLVARRRALLRVDDAGLTIIDGRGRERTFARPMVQAVHPYRLRAVGEAGNSKNRRELIEVDGARPVWILVDVWDEDGYRHVWPALGVVPGAERTIRRWAEAAEAHPDDERRDTRHRILIITAWLAWGMFFVVLSLIV